MTSHTAAFGQTWNILSFLRHQNAIYPILSHQKAIYPILHFCHCLSSSSHWKHSILNCGQRYWVKSALVCKADTYACQLNVYIIGWFQLMDNECVCLPRIVYFVLVTLNFSRVSFFYFACPWGVIPIFLSFCSQKKLNCIVCHMIWHFKRPICCPGALDVRDRYVQLERLWILRMNKRGALIVVCYLPVADDNYYLKQKVEGRLL